MAGRPFGGGRLCFYSMDNIDKLPDARSGVDGSNIQEIINAATSAGHGLQQGQNQYSTPPWLARSCAALLPFGHHENVLDPQCAAGNLVNAVPASLRFGTELDNRLAPGGKNASAMHEEVRRITGNCVHVFKTMDEFFPDARFGCITANPPFGIRWKMADDSTIDSTEWTWALIKKRLAVAGCGFLISNANTLERLGITTDPRVYLYQRFPGGGVWNDCTVELGIVHFYYRTYGYGTDQPPVALKRIDKTWNHVPSEHEIMRVNEELGFMQGMARPYGFGPVQSNWAQLSTIIREETLDRPDWNIYLDKEGLLRTYLSTKAQIKIKHDEIVRLMRLNRCHPLTLTTERETRKLLHQYLTSGIYTIQPEARKAIHDALLEVTSLACPIRPVTDFELVAYADEEEQLKCRALDPRRMVTLTVGKLYEVSTGTYTFTEKFTRKKLHFDEESGKTEIEDHECELSGEDRYIEVVDDKGYTHRFMERPKDNSRSEHAEELLWQFFNKPYVPSIKEVNEVEYTRHTQAMGYNEMLAGFSYFPGQLDYYARMACKDYGLVAADVGTGKSLGALTLIALKSPKRTLLIAPQGTMRSVGEEDEVDYQASQWVKEIQRFAPTEPVFQLFGVDDWLAILNANGNTLPPGIYITYPQAYFSNGAFENIPPTWDGAVEMKFCERYGLYYDKERKLDDCYSRNVGAANKHGVRCIAEPSLATQIAGNHGECWEMVIIDEAHLCCNLEAQVTKRLLRLQPKYRFAMTATPIPNIISNIFSLMGWLCVKDWYKGEQRNAAWPYSCDEIGRFNTTFLSTEVDLTAQQKAKAQGKKSWRKTGTRFSPVISSPARLLKLLKPTLAYISKEDCNPNLFGCEVIDVRVPTGKEQSKLYEFWLNRKNYLTEFKNPLTIAQVQSQRLRGICAAPASLDYTRGLCKSNFNSKMVTILELVRDCLGKGEQAVVVSARVGQSAAIASRLTDAGVQVARIDSTVPAELHTAEANRFKKGDARVMLMGIKCAQGHSFDQCPNLIIGSLEWSYGTLHQAKGRVWRLTSPKAVKIWCVLHKNTIEELLFDRVALKQDAATLCLHGKRVPRDFKTLDASEILAEHIVNYDAGNGEILSETECESQWPDLRRQLVMVNRKAVPIGAVAA